MEEEKGSAATELLMCNCEKPSIVQMSTTEKNLDRQFWDYEGQNLYENKSYKNAISQNKSTRMKYEKKTKNTGTSKWVLPFYLLIIMSCPFTIFSYGLWMSIPICSCNQR